MKSVTELELLAKSARHLSYKLAADGKTLAAAVAANVAGVLQWAIEDPACDGATIERMESIRRHAELCHIRVVVDDNDASFKIDRRDYRQEMTIARSVAAAALCQCGHTAESAPEPESHHETCLYRLTMAAAAEAVRKAAI